MPDQSHGCPCGSEIAPGGSPYEWITRELLEIIGDWPVVGGVLEPFLSFLYDTQMDILALCSVPPPTMPDFTLTDFLDPLVLQPKLFQAYAARLWQERCVCSDCPPVTGCGEGGSCYTLDHSDGYQRPDPAQTQYEIPLGVDVYVGVPGGTCYGLWNGVIIDWTSDVPGNWSTGVWTIANGNDTGAVTHRWDAVGDSLLVCVGGPIQPPTVPPIEIPPDLPDGPEPDPCDDTTICTAIDFLNQTAVSQTITQNQLVDWVKTILGLVTSVALGYTFDLPGVAPIEGSLAVALPRALAALAPMTPEQLVSISTTEVDGEGDLDLTDIVAVEIHPVFDGRKFGGYDANTPAFFTSFRSPGPGWLVFMSAYGVVQRVSISEQLGQMLPVPPLATTIRYTLNAGVTLNVTLHGRIV